MDLDKMYDEGQKNRPKFYNPTTLAQAGLIGYTSRITILKMVRSGELGAIYRPGANKNGNRYIITEQHIKEFLTKEVS